MCNSKKRMKKINARKGDPWMWRDGTLALSDYFPITWQEDDEGALETNPIPSPQDPQVE